MDNQDKRLIEALGHALLGEKVAWDEEISAVEWIQLFQKAGKHHVLPMVYEAVYECAAAKNADAVFMQFKMKMFHEVMVQTVKTGQFLKLYKNLLEQGIRPLVVKGIICRNLYPNPDFRISSDEDMLVLPEQFEACHKVLTESQMKANFSEEKMQEEHEVSYEKEGSPLYIEVHKSLFSLESDAYGDWNAYFEGVHDRAVEMRIGADSVLTLGYTEHLFYLICHSFKHFLHSGFGIRQVCDIVMFANAYGSQIDWEQVLKCCREIRAEKFTAALFQIGLKYFHFSPEKSGYPKEWQDIQVDETAMLEDLLDGGVYGGKDLSRRHSSNITLNAVAAEKKGKKPQNNVLKTVFPSAEKLKGCYSYLDGRPYLLPAAWAHRLIKYQRESAASDTNNPMESIQIGNKRVELLKQYGVLK